MQPARSPALETQLQADSSEAQREPSRSIEPEVKQLKLTPVKPAKKEPVLPSLSKSNAVSPTARLKKEKEWQDF